MKLPAAAALLLFGAMASAAPSAVEVPEGSAGIAFDDLRFSGSLGRILGNVFVRDPKRGRLRIFRDTFR